MAGRKQSSVFTVGALSCTTGIFLAAISGIILCVPFVMLADNAQLGAYGIFHALMTFITRVSAASLPFGLMALCANYSSRNDWRTVKHLRLFTLIAVMSTAVILALALAFAAQPLCNYIFAAYHVKGLVETATGVLYCAAAMILLVSVLYLYRGFYQGLDETVIDERSQIIEQTASALCSAGVLAWIYFHRDARNIILYLLIACAILAMLLAIGYYVLFDRLKYPRVEALAKAQLLPPVKKKKAISELFAFSMPGLSVAVMQGLMLLVNAFMFLPVCRMCGLEDRNMLDIYSYLTVHSVWLAEIPVILAYRFSSGVIFDIAEGVEKKNTKLLDSGIEKMFGRFLYAAVPLVFSLIILSPQFFYVLYGLKSAEAPVVFSWAMAEGLSVALAMISSWLMITLRFNQNSIFYHAVGLAVKLFSFWFLIRYMGYSGAMASTLLGVFTVLFLCLSRISNYFGISYQRLFLQLAKMLAACMCMNGVYALFKYFGLDGLHASRLLSAVHLLAMAAIAIPVYLFVTGMMKVPVQLFGRKKKRQ